MKIEEIILAKKLAGGSSPSVDIEQLNATENGTYSETGKAYSPVIVEVPEPTLITKSITANGTYTASDDNADGYSSVTVVVEGFNKKSIANTPTDIASFDDGTANPMPSLEISIETQQDLHGYDNPWVGGAGKNKLPSAIEITTSAGITATNSDGIITINGNAESGEYILIKIPSITIASGYIVAFMNTFVEATAYFLNDSTQIDYFSLGITNRIVNVSSLSDMYNKQFNTIRILFSSAQTLNNAKLSPMVVIDGADTTSFAPYSNICPISGHTEANVTVADDVDNPTVEHTTSIPFHDSSDNPITVYGGTLNVTSGELRVLGADTTVTENDNIEIATNASGFLFYIIRKTQNSIENNHQICDKLTRVEGGSASILYTTDSGFAVYSNGTVYFKVSSELDSVESIKNYLSSNPLHIYYELATPQTYQLTPAQVSTLLGQNNIFADCGQILEGEYFVTL